MAQFFYILTHLQEVIIPLFNWFGNWSYLLLFLVTFMETGLIIFPWLPGESLIFVAASLAALSPTIKISILVPGFFIAALLGDLTNYTIGTKLIKLPGLQKRVGGPRLAQTEVFFKRYGMLAVIFGRFVPVIRNFVPMIAGSAQFPLRKFMIGNLIGVTLWVALASGLGYFFGSIPLVKEHFSLVIIGIVLLSTLPAGIIYSLRAIRRHIIKKRQF